MIEHVVAVAVVVRDGRVLLAHRHPRRDWYPDCWDLVGGHLDRGEGPRAAMVRECREEIGIEVEAAGPMPMPSTDPAVEVHGFLVTAWSSTPRNMAPEEHDGLGWFESHELTELVLADPAIVPVVEAALRPAP